MIELSKTEPDKYYMKQALELAERAASENEVPVGALVVLNGEVIGQSWNQPISQCDPSAHAEVLAIRMACLSQKNYRIPGAQLYVTIEPCTMCLGAIIQARISRVIYGATEPKAGAMHSHADARTAGYLNHQFELEGGVLAEECSAMISSFFDKRRKLKAKLKGLK